MQTREALIFDRNVRDRARKIVNLVSGLGL